MVLRITGALISLGNRAYSLKPLFKLGLRVADTGGLLVTAWGHAVEMRDRDHAPSLTGPPTIVSRGCAVRMAIRPAGQPLLRLST